MQAKNYHQRNGRGQKTDLNNEGDESQDKLYGQLFGLKLQGRNLNSFSKRFAVESPRERTTFSGMHEQRTLSSCALRKKKRNQVLAE